MNESVAPRVLAVCRVHQLTPTRSGPGVTAIDKRPVAGTVKVRPLGVYGDVQVDHDHHGGPDQALYAYSQEDAAYWQQELGREIPPGLFGENLRTEGIETSGAVIGQRWRIGATLVVEVTSPRTPCATFAHRMGEPQWVKRFTAAARTGAYLRVVTAGTVAAGDAIVAEPTPAHGITVGAFFAAPTAAQVRTLQGLHDAGELALAASYAPYFARILRQERP